MQNGSIYYYIRMGWKTKKIQEVITLSNDTIKQIIVTWHVVVWCDKRQTNINKKNQTKQRTKQHWWFRKGFQGGDVMRDYWNHQKDQGA